MPGECSIQESVSLVPALFQTPGRNPWGIQTMSLGLGASSGGFGGKWKSSIWNFGKFGALSSCWGEGWARVGGAGLCSVLALLFPPSSQGLQGFQGDRGLAGDKGEEVRWLWLAQPWAPGGASPNPNPAPGAKHQHLPSLLPALLLQLLPRLIQGFVSQDGKCP